MMTPEQLRTVADTLDALTKLTKVLYEPIAHMDEMNASSLEITVAITRNGEPVSPKEAQELLEWVDGEEMQEDLRKWADEMETQ